MLTTGIIAQCLFFEIHLDLCTSTVDTNVWWNLFIPCRGWVVAAEAWRFWGYVDRCLDENLVMNWSRTKNGAVSEAGFWPLGSQQWWFVLGTKRDGECSDWVLNLLCYGCDNKGNISSFVSLFAPPEWCGHFHSNVNSLTAPSNLPQQSVFLVVVSDDQCGLAGFLPTT